METRRIRRPGFTDMIRRFSRIDIHKSRMVLRNKLRVLQVRYTTKTRRVTGNSFRVVGTGHVPRRDSDQHRTGYGTVINRLSRYCIFVLRADHA